ncbi:MAG: hypothetical protein AB8E15_00760 [Bdellovibrionales bacterium]
MKNMIINIQIAEKLEAAFFSNISTLDCMKDLLDQKICSTELIQFLFLIRKQDHSSAREFVSRLHGLEEGLYFLIYQSIQGIMIGESLEAWIEEAYQATQLEMEEDLRKLVYKLAVPVLFFLFPSFLMVVVGPILLFLVHQI